MYSIRIVFLIGFCLVHLQKAIAQQQLDCSFDANSFCNWSNGMNGLEDDFDWQINNSVRVDGFHSIPRTVSGTGDFAYAQGRLRPTETDTAKSWLRSPTIDGLSRQASLSFNYWKTAAPPVLQVCTRDAGVSQMRCLDTISGLGAQNWVRREVSIPPNPFPFQIVFVATNFRTALDLVGLDDIQFRTTTNATTLLDDSDTLYLQKLLEKKLAYNKSPASKQHVHRREDATFPPITPVDSSISANSRYSADALDELGRRAGGGAGSNQPLRGRESSTNSVVQKQKAKTQSPLQYQATVTAGAAGASANEEFDPRNIRIHQATTENPSVQQQRLQQQQQQEEQLRQQKLLELRQQQQQQQQQQYQQGQQQQQQQHQPQSPVVPERIQGANSHPTLGLLTSQQQVGQGGGNFQVLDPGPQQALPLPGPPTFIPQQPQPFVAPGLAGRPDVQAAPLPQLPDGQFFGPPLPALPPIPAEAAGAIPDRSLIFPVERSEPDIDAAVRTSTQVISLFIQRTTPPSGAQKFTLPPNWFRNTVNRNEVEQQAPSPIGAVLEVTTAAVTAAGHEHEHADQGGHEHDHGGEHHHHEEAFGVCQAVICTFDTTLCNWYNDLNANFDWKSKNNQSQYQGIPQDFTNRASYIFVSGDQRRPDQRAVIKSQPFVAPSGAYLEFFSFVTDPTVTRLSAYRTIGSEQPNVLWQTLGNGQIGRNQWQRVRIPLPASSFPMTLSIVADQLSTGQYIGVDDLRLVDNGGVDVGCAADTAFTNLASPRPLLLTPFPPKDTNDDNLQSNLQLSPLKAEALLNNDGTERQLAPAQLLNSSIASLLEAQPTQQTAQRALLAPLNPSIPPIDGGNSVELTSRPSSSQAASAIVQQRRIGVIEAKGSFGGGDGGSDGGVQQEQLTAANGSKTGAGGVQISSIDKNGQRKGLLQSIERQSQQWNVFQPAKSDELPREVIYATPTHESSTAAITSIAPLRFPVEVTPAGGSGLAVRSVDPVFPPGDSPEVNDQDSFYKRRGVVGVVPRSAAAPPRRSPLLRSESKDSLATVQGADEEPSGLGGSLEDESEIAQTISPPPPVPTRLLTTANPDPLGFHDFVSSLTRDLSALAAGGAAGGTTWPQNGAPLSNFNSVSSSNGGGSFLPQLGATALGQSLQPQPASNANWLQSILGKRK